MRERKGPSQWEYAKDKIWVQSLDDSSTDEEAQARQKEEEDEDVDEGGSDAATASSSRRVSEEGSSFGTGKMDDANFILNPELIQKLEEEAKKRMFAQQTEQQEQRRAKSFFRKPKLFRVLTGGGSGRSNGSSRCSSGGRNSPSAEDSEHSKNALILWRSPEEVLQSSKANVNLVNASADGKDGLLDATIADANAAGKTLPRNLLDFGATAIPLQKKGSELDGLKTETMDVVDSPWHSNGSDAMELD